MKFCLINIFASNIDIHHSKKNYILIFKIIDSGKPKEFNFLLFLKNNNYFLNFSNLDLFYY
jgi:hypothetical protein